MRKYVIGAMISNTPEKMPKTIGKAYFMVSLNDLNIFEIECSKFSNSFTRIATVPPLKPGIITPMPIKIPLANKRIYLLILYTEYNTDFHLINLKN